MILLRQLLPLLYQILYSSLKFTYLNSLIGTTMKALIDFFVKLFSAGILLAGLALLGLGGITFSNGSSSVAASCALGGLFVMWLSYCIGRMWRHSKADTDSHGLKQ